MGHNFFAGLGQRAVAALVDGHVHNNGAGGHGFDHFLSDQHRSELAGNQRGENHHVGFFDDGLDGLDFLGQPLFGQALGVTALAHGHLGRHAGVKGLGAQRPGLFGSVGADVDGGDHGAQAFGGGDGLEAGHARADDHDVGGLDHAHGGADHGHELAHVVGGHEHALVAGHGAHGGQGVHALGAGNTRNAVQGEADAAGVAQFFHGFAVHRGGGVQEGDQVLSVAQHVAFVLVHVLVEQGLFHLEDDIGLGKDFLRAIHQGRARGHIFRVGEERAFAGGFLHQHGGAFGDHFFHGLGGGGDAALARHNFFGNTDDHALKFHGFYSLLR